MTVSRSALDLALESYTLGESTPEQRATIADAAQAVLDGAALDWCVAHGRPSSIVYPEMCTFSGLDDNPCQFEVQVRVRVDP